MADLIGRRLRVHYNLHRGDFSVTDPGIGRVIANVPDVTLTAATFRVQAGCLAGIKRTGQRAVCAYVVGTVVAVGTDPDVTGWDVVTFNPRRRDDFHRTTGETVTTAAVVVFRDAHGYTPPI